MGRLRRASHVSKSHPYPRQRPLSQPRAELYDSSRVCRVESLSDGRTTFHLTNGFRYTISPTQKSSGEHHWGTIYFADCELPASKGLTCHCAIKATEFIRRGRPSRADNGRAAYRRPRQDFEREVIAFQRMMHGNVLSMHHFWEWNGTGYIAMKKMNGSLGDLIYEPVYREILDTLRHDETILAELFRQVSLCTMDLNRRYYPDCNIFIPRT